MKEPEPLHPALIAPCGMNCRLCRAYVRDRKACPGCRGSDDLKSRSAAGCRIKNCERLKGCNSGFCFECEAFACDRLIRLDKRYRTKYGMSMIENLENLERLGLKRFVEEEKVRWTCPECGAILCVHKGHCSHCGRVR